MFMALRRWPALDGIRGIAILLVVASHFGLGGTGGMVGVTLFFVLSGFLITYLLLDEREQTGGIDLRAFYGRRALRLLPALAFYMVGMAMLIWLFRLAIPIWDTTWPTALYLANYVQVLGVDLAAHRHTWSLAVEEHFYLVWPLLVVLGAANRVRLLAVAVGCLAIWRLVVGTLDPVWAYMGTDTNAYALGAGCLLAVLRHQELRVRLPRRSAEVGIGALVLLSVVPFTDLEHLYLMGVWLPVLGALVSSVLIWASIDHNPALLGGKTLVWLGGISYALYLWHAPILLLPVFDGPVGTVAALGVSIGLATLSWKLIEGPISRSRLRQRLSSRNALANPSLEKAT
jgi:peptidoglycan/LPS O-acetylase OafA/YrhL